MSLFHTRLILIWVGFLGVRFEVWGEWGRGGKIGYSYAANLKFGS